MKYLLARRKKLGGFVPARVVKPVTLEVPKLEAFEEFFVPGKTEISTTTAFVSILRMLLRHKTIGRHVVPIIPDEARTFGVDALFKDYGIYSPKGQLYEPVEKNLCSITAKPRMARFWKKASARPEPCRRSSPPAPATRPTACR